VVQNSATIFKLKFAFQPQFADGKCQTEQDATAPNPPREMNRAIQDQPGKKGKRKPKQRKHGPALSIDEKIKSSRFQGCPQSRVSRLENSRFQRDGEKSSDQRAAAFAMSWAIHGIPHSVVTFSIACNRNCLNPQSCLSRPNTASTATGRRDLITRPWGASKLLQDQPLLS